ncbi:MAG: ATP-binding cassette domain-containing protein [Actinobacteria bacterium]|nr:ATP-binding cassette domain-containing protein [Actinomycetota bacterium]
MNIKSPVDAMRSGIVYLPNKGIKTVYRNKTIVENLIIETSNYLNKSFFVNQKSEQQITHNAVKKFGIRGFNSINDDISSLSGGNMQKVLIARVMSMDPKVLIVMEPTEGIDIGAKEEIKQLILQAARQGKGVIIVTSDIDDIIEICHKVLIIRENKIRCVMEAIQGKRASIMEESHV